MATNVNPLEELLRRTRLYKPGGLPQVQNTGAPPELDPSKSELPLGLQDVLNAPAAHQTSMLGPIQAPQGPSEREKTLGSYREAMQQQAPSAPHQADYQPSVTRRIIGALLGGVTGITDPQAGKQLSGQIVSAPYNKALGNYKDDLTDYQQRLAQKKEAYETESSAEAQTAKIGESEAQKGAELNRAAAEKAREEREKFQISPEGQAAKLAQLKVTHPGTSKESKLYNVTLKNGKPAIVTRNASGQLIFGDTPLGEDAYDASTLREVGTTLPKDPKEESAKNRNVYNDFATGTKTKNPNITNDDIAKAWTDYKAQEAAKYEKSPQELIVSPQGDVSRATPGSHPPEGFTTLNQAGSQNVDTAQTRTMSEAAPKVLGFISKLEPLIEQQVKSLGPASSRWSEFMSGKVGAPNPEFIKLRTNMMLLQSLLMRMHAQRGSEYMLKHFRDLIDFSKESPENMKAALGEIKDYANSLIKKKRGTEEARGTEGTGETETTKPLSAEELRKKYGY